MIRFDSSFLVDLQRELVRERPAAAVTRNVKDFSKIPGLRVLSY
jgi:hypothetical protein